MKALVTGCAGFIGSHLTERLLNEAFEVIGIDCFTDYYPREIKERNIAQALKHRNFKLIKADILEMKGFPEVDYVFHQAAQPGVRASWGQNFEIYTRNNVLATQRLLEFYKDNIKKFIYASSSSVYGDAELPLKEETVLKPISPYGVTKLAGENLCYLYHNNYGIPVILLRYFTVYGPRQRPDMAIYKFTHAISKGEEVIVYGDGIQIRDFTYVDDIVEATLLAAESEFAEEVFNIGSGNRISVNELIRQIEEIMGKKAKLEYVERQKGDVKNTWADISKLKAMLNWESKVRVEQGLNNYIKWFKGK